jgi:hypothetical protein
MIGMVESDTAVQAGAPPRAAWLTSGATVGVGSLPHRNARQAAEFVLASYDVPTMPSLPRRSPAESPIAQALVGVRGVTLGQYGTVAIDVARLDPSAPVCTDLERDHFTGFRTFLAVAAERGHTGPVAWHFAGPISVGVALLRAGAAPDVAFEVSRATIRAHTRAVAAVVRRSLPDSPQLAIIDEPFADDVFGRASPITPDESVDLVSSAMAAVEPVATVGVHCCCDVDPSLLLAAGPHVVSLPVSSSIAPLAGYIDRFLAGGGWVLWGAVATGGPIGVTANRSWHRLASLWHDLVQRGCSPIRLREQSLLTADCGLGSHGVPVAERVSQSLRDIGRAVRSDATAAKLVLGG